MMVIGMVRIRETWALFPAPHNSLSDRHRVLLSCGTGLIPPSTMQMGN